MFKRMPSLWLTVTALGVGVSLAYALHKLQGHTSSERAAWEFINYLGWWWWGIPILVSAIGLFYAAQLDRPKSLFGFAVRLMALTGFVLYLGSWENTGLGPFAAIFTVLALVGLVRQLAITCSAQRERPSYRDESWLTRLYASLTTELDDYKRSHR